MSQYTLADVAHVVMGQSPDGSTYNKRGEGLPLLNGPAEFGAVSPIALQWTSAPLKLAMTGDILFCVRGNTLGRQNIADKTYAIGRGLAAIRARPEKADTEFIGLWLRNQASALLAAGTGSTFPSVSGDYLEKQPFPDVGIAEQHRIASRLKAQLAAVEEARQAAQAQIDDAKRLVPAILEAAFAETEGSELVKIGDAAKTMSGTTPSRDHKVYWEPPKYPWVKTGEVAFSPITQTEEHISEKALQECSLSLLPPGTVLVAMYGQGKTRGQSALLQVAATTNQACFAILPCETFDPEYLQFWLRHSYEALRAQSESRGGNQANLNGEILNSFAVPFIPRQRQQAIAKQIRASIEEAEHLQAGLDRQMADLQQLPARLLAEAFGEG